MKNTTLTRVGDLLYEASIITKAQLEWAMREQEETGKRVEDLLIEVGIVKKEDILSVLQIQLGIPYMDLGQYSIDYMMATKVPEPVARRYTAIAVGIENGRLQVAMKDPFNMFALDDLKLSTKMEIIPILADEKEILKLMDETFTSAQTKNIVLEVEKRLKEKTEKSLKGLQPVLVEEESAPIVQLVNNILERCILKGASDVHIEPFEKYVRIRYRVDGMLTEMEQIQKNMFNTIVTRIKIISGLDIAERRLPQDGRLSRRINDQQVDMRVSILPTIYGEKIVIRFIYTEEKSLKLEEIGFLKEDYRRVMNLLRNPHGIILLTGPTGSGKSTTLAAILKSLNKETSNIITVEDPVENIIEGINQVAVNNKIGLTFAQTLRAILRQDPDIMMIGEMRDSETSSIAVRAAITGHLVLSTLHTNDAASSIPRLIDMGTEAYLVGAALKGVISQRLVRKLCESCKERHLVTAVEARIYKIEENTVVYKPKGCSSCNHTGYKGRMAIHEVLVINKTLEELISRGDLTTEKIREVALGQGMRTLLDNALEGVRKGRTSLEEMMRVAYEQ